METVTSKSIRIVTPGELITEDTSFMRGHGTLFENGKIYSTVAGNVERISRLISVNCLKQRYKGEVGDIVVGRVVRTQGKRWNVDINSKQDAALLLSSINLPGGVQRRKLESDELQMRSFFAEGDVVFAEVQSLFQDGSLSLHTRSLQYGKLRNGFLVKVSPRLIPRSRQHLHELPMGVDIILGVNGYVWVSAHVDEEPGVDTYSAKSSTVDEEIREIVSRIGNSIRLLGQLSEKITDTTILHAYEAGLEYPAKNLLKSAVAAEIALYVKSRKSL